MAKDWDTALAIHGEISRLAKTGPIRRGIMLQSMVPWAVGELREAGLAKKPFFAEPKQWLRQTVLDIPEAFAVLRVNIDIELLTPKLPEFYRATGYRINSPNDRPYEYYFGARPIDVVLSFDLSPYGQRAFELLQPLLKD